MSYGGYPGQHGAPPPGQYNQGPPQGGYPQPGGYPPPQGYGAPPQQGGYGAPPSQGQWSQPPPQHQSYGQGPSPGQWGQALPPTPPYSGSFPPPQAYPQGGQYPPAQGGYGAPPPPGQHQGYLPPQMSGPPAPPSPGYDPNAFVPDMTAVANEVRRAMKGFGTDDAALIRAVAKLDPIQISGLRHAYTRLGRNLEKDITSETSGYYREALLAIVRGPLLQDAHTVHKSVKGLGTKEQMLNDALVGRSNADLRAIKHVYRQTYSKDMEADVSDDLSMKTKRHFKMILAATRNEESSPIILQQIDQDVNTLHSATEAKAGTDEIRVCEILSNRSDAQIRTIAQQYQQRFQKPLDAVIRGEFAGHMQEVLLLQLGRASDRAMSDAERLEEAMKGVGTKDELLVQRVVRAHWDRIHLGQVKGAYSRKYTTDKYKANLVARVGGEVSGHYREVMETCLA